MIKNIKRFWTWVKSLTFRDWFEGIMFLLFIGILGFLFIAAMSGIVYLLSFIHLGDISRYIAYAILVLVLVLGGIKELQKSKEIVQIEKESYEKLFRDLELTLEPVEMNLVNKDHEVVGELVIGLWSVTQAGEPVIQQYKLNYKHWDPEKGTVQFYIEDRIFLSKREALEYIHSEITTRSSK